MAKKLWLLGVVPGFMVVAAWMASPERMGTKELKIGIVDVSRCFDKYDRVNDEKKTLDDFVNKQKERTKELENEIKKIRNDIKGLPADAHNLRKQMIIDLKKAETSLQVESKLAEATYADMYSDAQVNMYNDIRKAIAKIAEEQGFDLVLKTEEAMLNLDSEESAARRISVRSVLYSGKGLDVTTEVIDRVNKEYKHK